MGLRKEGEEDQESIQRNQVDHQLQRGPEGGQRGAKTRGLPKKCRKHPILLGTNGKGGLKKRKKKKSLLRIRLKMWKKTMRRSSNYPTRALPHTQQTQLTTRLLSSP